MWVQGRNQSGNKTISLPTDEGMFLVIYSIWPTAGLNLLSLDFIQVELDCEDDVTDQSPFIPTGTVTSAGWSTPGNMATGYFIQRHKLNGLFRLRTLHSGLHAFGEQYAIDVSCVAWPPPPGEDPIIMP